MSVLNQFKDAKIIHLEAEKDNINGTSFYKKNGFEVIGNKVYELKGDRFSTVIMEDLLNELLKNNFIPETDTSTKLPDSSGAYLICAKSINVLPIRMRNLEYKFVNELPVIYVGIAGRPTSRIKSLRKRDYKNHFNGTARRSTLRKSLGVLFDFKKEFTNKDSSLNYKFIDKNEEQLTQWMKNNLIMYFVTIDNPMSFELYMINIYEPPLNLKDNNSENNRAFRKELSKLRTER